MGTYKIDEFAHMLVNFDKIILQRTPESTTKHLIYEMPAFVSLLPIL